MPVADLRGGPNSFIFMQFSAKKQVSTPTLGVGAPPSGKSWIRHCVPVYYFVTKFVIHYCFVVKFSKDNWRHLQFRHYMCVVTSQAKDNILNMAMITWP